MLPDKRSIVPSHSPCRSRSAVVLLLRSRFTMVAITSNHGNCDAAVTSAIISARRGHFLCSLVSMEWFQAFYRSRRRLESAIVALHGCAHSCRRHRFSSDSLSHLTSIPSARDDLAAAERCAPGFVWPRRADGTGRRIDSMCERRRLQAPVVSGRLFSLLESPVPCVSSPGPGLTAVERPVQACRRPQLSAER